MRGIETRLNKIERSLPAGKWSVLMNVWNSAGVLIHTNGTINPVLTVNVRGVKPAPDAKIKRLVSIDKID